MEYIEIEKVKELVESGCSERDVAKHFGWFPSKAHRVIKKLNLTTCKNYSIFPRKEFNCLCGEINPNNFYGKQKQCCKKCHVKKQVGRWETYKREAVKYKGGKCQFCDYSRCPASLAFHHIDPTKKDPEWKLMKNRAFKNWKHEVDKCILLCHNCHYELHYALKKGFVYSEKENLKNIFKDMVEFVDDYATI